MSGHSDELEVLRLALEGDIARLHQQAASLSVDRRNRLWEAMNVAGSVLAEANLNDLTRSTGKATEAANITQKIDTERAT